MRFVLALAVTLLASGAYGQTMHKCVDARGVTHYTDRPLPGCKGKEVDIQGQPPISGTLSAPKEDFRRDDRDYQRRKIDEERIREAQRNTREKQNRECAQMQAELQKMESGGRIARIDEKGELSYLEDDERSQRTAKLQDEIAQKCR